MMNSVGMPGKNRIFRGDGKRMNIFYKPPEEALTMKLLKLVLLALFSTLLFCSCSTNGENGGDFTSEEMLIPARVFGQLIDQGLYFPSEGGFVHGNLVSTYIC